MPCNLDIRRIELYKQFRGLVKGVLTAEHEWQVFGYYDSMNVEYLELQDEKHPLEYVYDDSQRVSFNSHGSLKKHVIYAIGLGEPKVYQNFWQQRDEHPLLLVSLLHFKHPMECDQQNGADQNLANQGAEAAVNQPIESSLEKYINALQVSLDNKGMNSAIYSAFDCNDAIVFTFADALDTAMQNISEITKDNGAIREIFTIYARKNNIHSLIDEPLKNAKLDALKTIWKEHQPVLEKVDVFMRDASHSQLITDTKNLEIKYKEEYYSSAYSGFKKAQYPFRWYIMPGHEDVLLTLEKVPLPLFEKMFSPSSNEGVLLDGFFLKRISRTIIYTTPLPAQFTQEVAEKGEALPTRASDLVEKLKKAFDYENDTDSRLKNALITTFSDVKYRMPIWLGALMELLVELSNIEISLTAYDNYAQAICAQETMINTLCKLVEDAKKYACDPEQKDIAKELIEQIYSPSSDLSSNFREYLNGWSQLSFHAMHAEWQLTQSSDINRLYLFPAKLCRLYSEFMKLSSEFLNKGKKHDECMFFITPNIRDIPQFLSIFQPIKRPDNLSYKLIHGEIPADNMFSPQVILPHLVHEVAHYAGTVFRKRELRNNVYLKCLLAYLLHQILKVDLIDQPIIDNTLFFRFLIDQLVDKMLNIKNDVFGKLDQNDYGDNVQNTVEETADKLLSQLSLYIGPVIADTIGLIPKYAEKPRLEQMLSIAEYFKGPEMVHDILSYAAKTNIHNVSNDLMTILREAFSDLCMVKMVDLTLVEYLSIICHGIRYDPNKIEAGDNFREPWARHERFYAVMQTVFGKEEIAQKLLEGSPIQLEKDARTQQLLKLESITFQLNMNKSISPEHHQNVKERALTFFRYEESLIEKDEKYKIYTREMIRYYLEEASKELDKDLESNHVIKELRNVYRVIAIDLRARDESFALNKLAEIGKIIHLKSVK